MEFDVSKFYEAVAMFFMAEALDHPDDKNFEGVLLGEDVHMKVKDDSGEVLLKVVGRDYNELGDQLVLGCFHKMSVDCLVAQHLRPLLRVAPPPLRTV